MGWTKSETLPAKNPPRSISSRWPRFLPLGGGNGIPHLMKLLGSRAEFDARCAVFLVEQMDISPSEASRSSVWSFITLYVLPDVAAWRFQGLNAGRFLGRRSRNTFQRLWWRGHLISRAKPGRQAALLRALPEDALVQITERPGVYSDGRLATAVASVGLEEVEVLEAGLREQAFRSALKRIRQVLPVICTDALEEDQLRNLGRGHFQRAVDSK